MVKYGSGKADSLDEVVCRILSLHAVEALDNVLQEVS